MSRILCYGDDDLHSHAAPRLLEQRATDRPEARRGSTLASSVDGLSAPVLIVRHTARIRCAEPRRLKFTERPATCERCSCYSATPSWRAPFAISGSRSTMRSRSRSRSSSERRCGPGPQGRNHLKHGSLLPRSGLPFARGEIEGLSRVDSGHSPSCSRTTKSAPTPDRNRLGVFPATLCQYSPRGKFGLENRMTKNSAGVGIDRRTLVTPSKRWPRAYPASSSQSRWRRGARAAGSTARRLCG